MPRQADFSKFDPEDFQYAVEEFLRQKKVTPLEVRAAANRGREIAELRDRLESLEAGRGRRGRPPGRAVARGKKKRKVRMTPKMKAARQIQGKYLGTLKKLKKAADRNKYKTMAKKEGREAAIKWAGEMLATG